jgi:hypothetical protein
MTDPMQTEREALKPCPFCGHTGLIFSEGSTFRWRIAECQECGATAGEERIQTMGDGDAEAWETNCRERLIGAWNRRAESDERASELRSLRDALTLAKARIAELERIEAPAREVAASYEAGFVEDGLWESVEKLCAAIAPVRLVEGKPREIGQGLDSYGEHKDRP